jgi:hypothetical protein
MMLHYIKKSNREQAEELKKNIRATNMPVEPPQNELISDAKQP